MELRASKKVSGGMETSINWVEKENIIFLIARD